MRLVSYSIKGWTSFGLVEGEHIFDLMARTGAATLRDAIARGALAEAAQTVRGTTPNMRLADVTLLPPIPDPDKVICIGLNYRDHAAEAGMKLPEHPQVFTRLNNTLVAHGAPLVRPTLSTDFDYEGELAIIIGKPGRAIEKAQALDHVFGYACFNDGSLRDFQFKHSLTVGKNFVSTGGFGPWIATADGIPDPSRLMLTTRLNGQQVQHKELDNMIFDVAEIIAYVSQWTELVPGDVIATGTPEGVGFARKPPLWLKPGDTIEIEISDVGVLRNSVVAA